MYYRSLWCLSSWWRGVQSLLFLHDVGLTSETSHRFKPEQPDKYRPALALLFSEYDMRRSVNAVNSEQNEVAGLCHSAVLFHAKRLRKDQQSKKKIKG